LLLPKDKNDKINELKETFIQNLPIGKHKEYKPKKKSFYLSTVFNNIRVSVNNKLFLAAHYNAADLSMINE
jgi:hypothetical protein